MRNCIFSCNASSSYTGEVTTIYPDEDLSEFNGENNYYDDDDESVMILDGQVQVS